MNSGLLIFIMLVVMGAIFIGLYLWARKGNAEKYASAARNADRLRRSPHEGYYYYNVPQQSMPDVVTGGEY